MPKFEGLARLRRTDCQALIDNILRKGTPKRVHHIELYHDGEVRDAIAERFDLMAGIKTDDPHYEHKKLIAVNRFTGFDIVQAGLVGTRLDYNSSSNTTGQTPTSPKRRQTWSGSRRTCPTTCASRARPATSRRTFPG